MDYNTINLSELIDKAFCKVSKDLSIASQNQDIESFIKKYGLQDEYTEYYYFKKNSAKIIIIGNSEISKKDILGIAKTYEIDSNAIEFVEYDACTNFNFQKLQYSDNYTDIFVGPMPHCNNGMSKYSSFIENVKQNQSTYAKLTELRDSNSLKITKASLKQAFENSRYLKKYLCA